MTELALYKVVDRELAFIAMVDVDATDHDTWLQAHGYDRTHTLRTGIVKPVTQQERDELKRIHDNLKAVGRLPSGASVMLGKLAA